MYGDKGRISFHSTPWFLSVGGWLVPETAGTIGRKDEAPVHTGKRTLDLSAGSLVSVPAILTLHCRILQATCALRSLFKAKIILPSTEE